MDILSLTATNVPSSSHGRVVSCTSVPLSSSCGCVVSHTNVPPSSSHGNVVSHTNVPSLQILHLCNAKVTRLLCSREKLPDLDMDVDVDVDTDKGIYLDLD